MISFSVFIHKWTGLFTAVFLIIAGVTGSLLAFEKELEALVNPGQYVVPARVDANGQPAPMLDPFDLHERAIAALPGYQISGFPFLREPDRSVRFNLARSDKTLPDADQAFLDPYDGRLLGIRKYGATPFDRTTLIGFIYKLHYALALPRPYGEWFFGIVALVWTVNCLVGIVSTFPRISPFWRRWLPAWLIKRSASTYRLHYDIHRASGLWLWGVLFLFAWSSVMLNLRQEVYTPVMSTFLDFRKNPEPRKPDTSKPLLDWRQAYAIAVRTMDEVASKEGFTVNFRSQLFYNRRLDTYIYYANTSRDVQNDRGQTGVFIDARTGALLHTRIPTGEYSGDTVSRWLQSLHMAKVFGLPYRIFVAIIGLALAISAYTGLYVWWKKRKARLISEKRKQAKAARATSDLQAQPAGLRLTR
ncbi:PepSY-associated TM helix domain-containing protein [Tardiphaga alba]|nr:PepSY-associated TM helix domain-containing protein [Tardiphaga alba]